jgi:hypothetical protein
MPLFFLIPPAVRMFRKRIAKKQGKEYKPLFPKTKDKVDSVKLKLKRKWKH